MCGPAPPRVQARFHRFRGWPENLAEENKFIGIDLNKIEKNNAKWKLVISCYSIKWFVFKYVLRKNKINVKTIHKRKI